MVGVSLLLFLSAIPAFISTAHGHLHVGFVLENFCVYVALHGHSSA